MPGLVPGISIGAIAAAEMDARNKSGHDGRVFRQDGKEPAGTPADAPDEPVAGPPDPETGYDGSEDEFHYGGEVWKGSIAAPGFGEWLGDLERRVGRIPMEEGEEGRLIECHVGERVFVGPPDTPEFEAWRERQRQREEREKQQAAACAHDKT